MKKIINLFLLLSISALFSCSTTSKGLSDSSRRVLDKTYDVTSIPPAFDKNNVGTLLVSTDFRRKKYRGQFTEIVKAYYKGKSQMVSAKDKLDQLYPDLTKYRFIFYEESFEETRGAVGSNYNNAYGVLSVGYGMYDRVEKKSYPGFFRGNRNWRMSAAYAFEKLNAKL